MLMLTLDSLPILYVIRDPFSYTPKLKKRNNGTINHLSMSVVKLTIHTAGDLAGYLYQQTVTAISDVITSVIMYRGIPLGKGKNVM